MEQSEYKARALAMADSRGVPTEFDASYGPAAFDPTRAYAHKDLTSPLATGGTRVPIVVNPDIMNSDEHIVQALSHEISEIEALEFDAARPLSGTEIGALVDSSIKGNLQYEAVNYGD